MPLPTPGLDDRTFQDIVDEAKRLIPRYCPEWTNHNVSDPGVALIELFAWMSEMVLFRVNQVPERLYVHFLNMVGIEPFPPSVARADLTFWLSAVLRGPGPGAGRHRGHDRGRRRGQRRRGGLQHRARTWSSRRRELEGAATMAAGDGSVTDVWDDLRFDTRRRPLLPLADRHPRRRVLPGLRARAWPAWCCGSTSRPTTPRASASTRATRRCAGRSGTARAGSLPRPRRHHRRAQPRRRDRPARAGRARAAPASASETAYWLRARLLAAAGRPAELPARPRGCERRRPPRSAARSRAEHAETGPRRADRSQRRRARPGVHGRPRPGAAAPRGRGRAGRRRRRHDRLDRGRGLLAVRPSATATTSGTAAPARSASAREVRYRDGIDPSARRDPARRRAHRWSRATATVAGRAATSGRGTLTVMRSTVHVRRGVINLAPAAGGVDAETVAEAKVRGPLTLRTGQRAVTAGRLRAADPRGLRRGRARPLPAGRPGQRRGPAARRTAGARRRGPAPARRLRDQPAADGRRSPTTSTSTASSVRRSR